MYEEIDFEVIDEKLRERYGLPEGAWLKPDEYFKYYVKMFLPYYIDDAVKRLNERGIEIESSLDYATEIAKEIAEMIDAEFTNYDGNMLGGRFDSGDIYNFVLANKVMEIWEMIDDKLKYENK